MDYRRPLVGILLLLLLASPVTAAIVVNEVMSKNTVTILDDDGAPSDWFELYNNGTSSVDLTGYYATDKASAPTQWRFPSVILPPNAYLLVWASSKNRTNGTFIHTSFSISAGGEPIIVTAPDGITTVSSIPAVALANDQTYGHLPDGAGPLGVLPGPTPGVTNAVAIPPLALTFSRQAGVTSEAFLLNITTNRNATIHYTLDGSTPTAASPVLAGPLLITNNSDVPNNLSLINETSPAWSAPIGHVRKATVVRAFAVDGNETTPVKTATYLVGDAYTLPIVSVTTDLNNLFDYETGIYLKGLIWDQAEEDGWQGTSTFHPANYREEWERPVHLEMFESNGTRVIDQDVGMQISGQGSRKRQQKSLRFYARSDYGPSAIPYAVFPDQPGIGSYRRLTLRNPDDDERTTFIRDVLAQQFAQGMDVASEDYRPVVAFLDGEYWGLYPLREKANQHYLESHYGVDKDNVVILEDNAIIDEGVAGDELPYTQLVDYARTHDLRDPVSYAYVQDRMDTDSFMRYYLLETYIGNTDWPSRNVVFWRLKTNTTNTTGLPYGHDGKWRWILHDTDYAFSYMPNQGTDYDMFKHIDRTTWGGALWRSLARNEDFRDRFVNAAADELSTTFEPANVVATIDGLAAGLIAEVPEQARRWTGLNGTTQWLANLDSLRNYAQERPVRYRNHLVSYFGLGGTAQLTVTGNDALGTVMVNGRAVDMPLTSIYFQDVPITLAAQPAPDQQFLGWTGAASGTDPVIKIVLSEDTTIGAVFGTALGETPTEHSIWFTRKWPATEVTVSEGSNEELQFSFANPQGLSTTIVWSVDGVLQNETDASFAVGSLAATNHTVTATVTSGASSIITTWHVRVNPVSGLVCYNTIGSLPATCVGGVILAGNDTLSGSCRTLTCTSENGSMRVLACEKPNSQSPVYFEMYRQTTTDSRLRVCLAQTCIGSNGFAQKNFADACVMVNVTRDISFSSTTPPGTAATLAIGQSLNFSYAVSNPAALPTGSLWLLDDEVLPLQEDLSSYEFVGQSEGVYTLSVLVSSNETSIRRDWQVTVEALANGTGNETNTTGNNSNQTTVTMCYSTVRLVPATCIGGIITSDTATGSRAVTCAQGANSISVIAWDKPDNTFEIYRQSSSGVQPDICLGVTCLRNNGYAKSASFPICINVTVNATSTNQTNTTVNSTRNISLASSTPSGSFVSIAEPDTQAFSIALNNPDALPVTITWRKDGVNQSGAFNQLNYQFVGNYSVAGTYEILVTAQSPQNSVSKLWTLSVADTPVNGTGNQTNTTVATVSLGFAQWFPQGRNTVLVCTADGFTPTDYDFFFGDGSQNLNYHQNNVWHTYAETGSYVATCVARNGAVSKNATFDVVLT